LFFLFFHQNTHDLLIPVKSESKTAHQLKLIKLFYKYGPCSSGWLKTFHLFSLQILNCFTYSLFPLPSLCPLSINNFPFFNCAIPLQFPSAGAIGHWPIAFPLQQINYLFARVQPAGCCAVGNSPAGHTKLPLALVLVVTLRPSQPTDRPAERNG
jgi:hypothetical protein